MTITTDDIKPKQILVRVKMDKLSIRMKLDGVEQVYKAGKIYTILESQWDQASKYMDMVKEKSDEKASSATRSSKGSQS